jgi:hypothetical protein
VSALLLSSAPGAYGQVLKHANSLPLLDVRAAPDQHCGSSMLGQMVCCSGSADDASKRVAGAAGSPVDVHVTGCQILPKLGC